MCVNVGCVCEQRQRAQKNKYVRGTAMRGRLSTMRDFSPACPVWLGAPGASALGASAGAGAAAPNVNGVPCTRPGAPKAAAGAGACAGGAAGGAPKAGDALGPPKAWVALGPVANAWSVLGPPSVVSVAPKAGAGAAGSAVVLLLL